VLFVIVSCAKKDKLFVDVSNIDAKVDIMRFDQAFYTTPYERLDDLKNEYPYLFPVQTPDSVWVQKMQDKDEQELYAETQKIYPNLESEKEQLASLFKHVKYYYNNFKEPTVITILSNVDYLNNVVYADSLLFISLDVFLGKENAIYQDFPTYIKRNFTKDHIGVAVAEALARREIPRAKSRTFVSRIIREGKLLYMVDAFLPDVNDATKMGYTQEQLDWANYNDVDVWKYFIQKEYLFSTDQELSRRFIENAPFSKFYKANDNESPGRIGSWFGWQIVRSYMQHNDVSLQDMLQTDNETIFKKSKYKPTK
jgi:gliding motility-associated lipoprotein GldB